MYCFSTLVHTTLFTLLFYSTVATSRDLTPPTSSLFESRSTTSQPSSFTISNPYFVLYSDVIVNGGVPPTASSLSGWNVFNLAFWTVAGPVDMALAWATLTSAQRAATKLDYASGGIKLMVSAFGSTDTPTTNGDDPIATANALAAYVTTYSLDGVDVDYEDFAAMNGGHAEAWLISFTTHLRSLLPSSDGYIITHAPVAPWFTSGSGIYPGGGYLHVDSVVGSLIDAYLTQFYNQGSNEYVDCVTLLNTSTSLPGSSLFQIASSGVSLDKLIIGKPATPSLATNGYMPVSTLSQCVASARSRGYNGGLSLWEYPSQPADYVVDVWKGTGTGVTTSSMTSSGTTVQSTTTSSSSSSITSHATTTSLQPTGTTSHTTLPSSTSHSTVPSSSSHTTIPSSTLGKTTTLSQKTTTSSHKSSTTSSHKSSATSSSRKSTTTLSHKPTITSSHKVTKTSSHKATVTQKKTTTTKKAKTTHKKRHFPTRSIH
jgi:chitinase